MYLAVMDQKVITVHHQRHTSSTVSSFAKPSSSAVGACTATSAVAPVARQNRRRSNLDGILRSRKHQKPDQLGSSRVSSALVEIIALHLLRVSVGSNAFVCLDSG